LFYTYCKYISPSLPPVGIAVPDVITLLAPIELYDIVLATEPLKEVPEASPLPVSSNVREFVVMPPPLGPV
jgi:hypothetical protein